MIKKIKLLSLICLFMITLSGCMYLMEEDPWEWQKKSNERERIRKEQRERRLQYLQSHKELTARQEGLIESGIIGIGLTKEQVNLIKNISPDEIKQTTEYGADEVWIYKWQNIKQYLYFKDNVLTKVDKNNKNNWEL